MTELAFDPKEWTGDYDELAPWLDLLAWDVDLCARTFASENEAFNAALYLGARGGHTQERTTKVY